MLPNLCEVSVAVRIAPEVLPLLETPRMLEVAIEQVIATLLEEHRLMCPSPLEVSILLTSDGEIEELNQLFRGVAQPTDVLSFAYLDIDADLWEDPTQKTLPVIEASAEGEPVPLGDIVISVETAQRQAPLNGHDLTTELLMLVAHGMLHLLGYDDETEMERQAMNRRAVAVLQSLGYPAKEVWCSRYDEA